MARPKPVPSRVVFLSSSNLWNFVNSLSIFSGLIPLPVSSTDMIKLHLFLLFIHDNSNSIEPSSVYFAALVSKLVITSFTLELSPCNMAGKSLG